MWGVPGIDDPPNLPQGLLNRLSTREGHGPGLPGSVEPLGTHQLSEEDAFLSSLQWPNEEAGYPVAQRQRRRSIGVRALAML